MFWNHSQFRLHHRGLTLAELLVASVVTSLIALTTLTLATTVRNGADYQQGLGTATQHGTVVIERIQRIMRGAYANESFPGFVSFATTVGSYQYPDVVAVWDRSKIARSVTNELPLISEIVIFCPSSASPNKLVEVTMSSETSEVPDISDLDAWLGLVEKMLIGGEVKELTDLLRIADAGRGSYRGCVRFEILQRPTAAQLKWYRDLDSSNQTYDNWRSIPWPQDLYTRYSGIRQAWCRIEMQMVNNATSSQRNDRQNAVPFFGSVALYYNVQR